MESRKNKFASSLRLRHLLSLKNLVLIAISKQPNEQLSYRFLKRCTSLIMYLSVLSKWKTGLDECAGVKLNAIKANKQKSTSASRERQEKKFLRLRRSQLKWIKKKSRWWNIACGEVRCCDGAREEISRALNYSSRNLLTSPWQVFSARCCSI